MPADASDTGGEPKAERPVMPAAYGISESPEGMLPWRWAEERLERATNYWVATVGPDGRPHVVPVWGLWVDRRFYFGGGGRKARDLAVNPNVVVHLESGDEVVIVEGAADGPAVPAPDVLPRLREASLAKYKSWADDPEPVYVVRPRTVIAWRDLPKDATRWRFGRPGREALSAALSESAGVLEDEDYPEWDSPDKVSAWVRESRRADSDRLERKLDPTRD